MSSKARAQSEDALPATKTCRRCGETKPVDRFHAGKNLCKACRREVDRERKERRQEAPAEREEPHSPAGTG